MTYRQSVYQEKHLLRNAKALKSEQGVQVLSQLYEDVFAL
jgi:hypothetical protein